MNNDAGIAANRQRICSDLYGLSKRMLIFKHTESDNSSSNGDTILVKNGTYFENVKVTKQLILRGIGNPVIDARTSKSAITLFANGIILEGFTAISTRTVDMNGNINKTWKNSSAWTAK